MHPIPTVGTHIHETAAALRVVVQRVELLPVAMLGVRAADDDVVLLEASEAFVCDVLVGDHVELIAHGFEPVDQVKIRRVLPRCLHQEVIVFRPDRKNRPQA